MSDTDYIDRLIEEYSVTGSRIKKLSSFIDRIEFTRLPHPEQDDLLDQLAAMREYHTILGRRMNRARKESKRVMKDGSAFWDRLWKAGLRW